MEINIFPPTFPRTFIPRNILTGQSNLNSSTFDFMFLVLFCESQISKKLPTYVEEQHYRRQIYRVFFFKWYIFSNKTLFYFIVNKILD